jgi:branched-chain amino acid transport system permease protein
MAVLGGAGQVWGALLGSALVTVLKDQLQRILPALFGAKGNYELIIFGGLLVLLLQTAREGLWPRLAALMPAGAPPPPPVAADPLPRRDMPAAGEPILTLDAARKEFGGLVGLIGPNGAGKSTTFNLVTGVLPVTRGTIRFRGNSIGSQRPQAIARLGIARTFQHVHVHPSMSVLENVALGAHLRGTKGAVSSLLRLDRGEEKRLLHEAALQIERVGLKTEMYKAAGSLALGQLRIIEIARALCLNPILLLLDEPAAGLRHREKQDLAQLLRKLKSEGVTILLVEHDMSFVMGLTDHIVVVDFGTKIAEGAPKEIVKNPAVIEAYLGGAA